MNAALFTFLWDFVDEGVDDLAAYIRDLGVTRVVVTSQYHAGFFMHPHNPRRKTHLLEDGVSYFHPDPSRYDGLAIRPIPAAMCADRDWFALVCERLVDRGLEVSAWHVCLHNTRLGLLHPDATIRNAYGDSYPHALSPAHPDAVAFVEATVKDIATNYPLASVTLEAPDYRKRAHGSDWVSGHHHERDGVYLRPLEQALMDVSFNSADVEQAEAAGIDIEALRLAIIAHMDRYFEEAPVIPAELPGTIDQFCDAVPAYAACEQLCRDVEARLLVTMKDALAGTGSRLEAGPSPHVDWVLQGAYGLGPEETAAAVRRARELVLPHQRLNFTLRMGFNHPGMGTPILSEAETCAMAQVVAGAGADELVFYNYGEAPRRSVDWLKPALAGLS
ncbi:MAG: hypothetical protein QGF67_01730 [Lentisphaeria bacterium]|jgi:hypothetical protein|nr:hypothetical protein [Lentisphaeria bacterium]MDP7740132.1 hypothetical protein [Lentisphaeria bacterium]